MAQYATICVGCGAQYPARVASSITSPLGALGRCPACLSEAKIAALEVQLAALRARVGRQRARCVPDPGRQLEAAALLANLRRLPAAG
jgi:hypothetical protein